MKTLYKTQNGASFVQNTAIHQNNRLRTARPKVQSSGNDRLAPTNIAARINTQPTYRTIASEHFHRAATTTTTASRDNSYRTHTGTYPSAAAHQQVSATSKLGPGYNVHHTTGNDNTNTSTAKQHRRRVSLHNSGNASTARPSSTGAGTDMLQHIGSSVQDEQFTDTGITTGMGVSGGYRRAAPLTTTSSSRRGGGALLAQQLGGEVGFMESQLSGETLQSSHSQLSSRHHYATDDGGRSSMATTMYDTNTASPYILFVCNFMNTKACKKRIMEVAWDSGYLPRLAMFRLTDRVFGSSFASFYFCQLIINTKTLVDSYKEMLLYCGDKIVEALKLVTLAPLPILFHCTLGKDRTGILSALILSILGANDSMIAHDYNLTEYSNDRRYEEFLYNFIVIDSGLAPQFSEAGPHHIVATLQFIRKAYGSVLNYVQLIGFGTKWQRRLKERFLANYVPERVRITNACDTTATADGYQHQQRQRAPVMSADTTGTIIYPDRTSSFQHGGGRSSKSAVYYHSTSADYYIQQDEETPRRDRVTAEAGGVASTPTSKHYTTAVGGSRNINSTAVSSSSRDRVHRHKLQQTEYAADSTAGGTGSTISHNQRLPTGPQESPCDSSVTRRGYGTACVKNDAAVVAFVDSHTTAQPKRLLPRLDVPPQTETVPSSPQQYMEQDFNRYYTTGTFDVGTRTQNVEETRDSSNPTPKLHAPRRRSSHSLYSPHCVDDVVSVPGTIPVQLNSRLNSSEDMASSNWGSRQPLVERRRQRERRKSETSTPTEAAHSE
eukprot:Lankesteria_metandrocarpae@DN4247_c0_g1_i15.p1